MIKNGICQNIENCCSYANKIKPANKAGFIFHFVAYASLHLKKKFIAYHKTPCTEPINISLHLKTIAETQFRCAFKKSIEVKVPDPYNISPWRN